MKLKKICSLLVLCILIIITQTGCGSEVAVSDSGFYLDTVCRITVYSDSEKKGQEMLDKAFAACTKYENMLSKTRPSSDIYRINESRGKAVKVQPETYRLVKQALEYGELSGGKFDITIGAVSELWDFKSEKHIVPDREKIEAALKTVDYTGVKLLDGSRIRLENPKARLDLGGIAKGYIGDRVAEVLEKEGAERALITLGGNVIVLGSKDRDTPWEIGVERPYSDRTDILGVVSAEDRSIVSSGIYERKFVKDGKLYHHVLDPETGYPAETGLDEVTISGPRGASAECDAYSTMCLLLGQEKGMELLEKNEDLEGAFISSTDKIVQTDGMNLRPAE